MFPDRSFVFKAAGRGHWRVVCGARGRIQIYRTIGVSMLTSMLVDTESIAPGGILQADLALDEIRGCTLRRSRLFDQFTLVIDRANGSIEIEAWAAGLEFHAFIAGLRESLPAGIRFDDTTAFTDRLDDLSRSRRYSIGAGNEQSITKRSTILTRWWFLMCCTIPLPPLMIAMWVYCWWLTLRRFRVVTNADGIKIRYRFRNRRLRWEQVSQVTTTEVVSVTSPNLLLQLHADSGVLALPTSGQHGTNLMREFRARGLDPAVAHANKVVARIPSIA